MSLKYQLTLFAIVLCPIGLLILYFILSLNSSCQSSEIPETNPNILNDTEEDIVTSSMECHVSSWTEWSSCSCLYDNNVMYRSRTVYSNYDPKFYKTDPCANIDNEQYIHCLDHECGNGNPSYCNETLNLTFCRDGKTVQFYYFDRILHSCLLRQVQDCEDLESINNKFPTNAQCEKLCFF